MAVETPTADTAAPLWLRLVVLWLAGSCLRLTILAVPPVVPLIEHDLGLDETGVAALTGLPVLLLAVAAVPGSLLIARLGARRALLAGLLLIAGASALRGLGPALLVLFGTTVCMGIGVSVCQPALPSMVRLWFPGRAGLATALYSNGLLIGEIVAAGVTLPLILPLLRRSWEWTFAFWSLPVWLTALLVVGGTRGEQPVKRAAPTRWWPDWSRRQTWLLSLTLGGASVMYFGTNAFVPDFLRATGRSGLVAAALAATNGGQLPASLLIAAFSNRLVGRRAPFLPIGALALLAVLGFALLPGDWPVVCAALIGFSTAFVLVLSLALPPLLADPDEVHRLSAALFTISYALAFVGPIVGGALWDNSGVAQLAFVPATLAAMAVVVLPTWLKLPGDQKPVLVGDAL